MRFFKSSFQQGLRCEFTYCPNKDIGEHPEMTGAIGKPNDKCNRAFEQPGNQAPKLIQQLDTRQSKPPYVLALGNIIEVIKINANSGPSTRLPTLNLETWLSHRRNLSCQHVGISDVLTKKIAVYFALGINARSKRDVQGNVDHRQRRCSLLGSHFLRPLSMD